VSRNGKKLSHQAATAEQQRAIATALEKMFRAYNVAGSAQKDRRIYDFVFHMTDWQEDLIRLSRLYQHPQKYPQSEWNDAVFGFLCHAVNHLMAASKLNDTLTDPFDATVDLRHRKLKRMPKARKVA